MHQVQCHYCYVSLYRFQAHLAHVVSYAPDMTPVTEDIYTCYHCAMREEGNENE